MRDIEAATDRKSEMRLAPQVEERAAEPTTLASAEYRNAFDSYLRNGRAGMTGDEVQRFRLARTVRVDSFRLSLVPIRLRFSR